jgi:hypothetical protein
LSDFVLLANNFVELDRRQSELQISSAEREPLKEHIQELHKLLKFLAKLNS